MHNHAGYLGSTVTQWVMQSIVSIKPVTLHEIACPFRAVDGMRAFMLWNNAHTVVPATRVSSGHELVRERQTKESNRPTSICFGNLNGNQNVLQRAWGEAKIPLDSKSRHKRVTNVVLLIETSGIG